MEYERKRGGYGSRERGRGYGSNYPPKPVETGKEYEVEIQEISRRGEGIARIKGLVIFVPNTKNGDKVRIRITRISRRFCEAEVVGKDDTKAQDKTKEVEDVKEETVTKANGTEKPKTETNTD